MNMKSVILPLGILFIFIITFVTSFNPTSTSSPVAIHPERNKLLENALSWLTLRQNGDPLSTSQAAPFLERLREKYRSSSFFRSLVIAFHLGVLPKLTLQQGQTCDPAYTLRYKSSLNNSVTWHRIKNFTFQNYYKRDIQSSAGLSYCDYRKGLVCLPTTKTCGCPEGSKMGPIGGGPDQQEQRCLIQENEPCPLEDTAESSETVTQLNIKLPQLIFNLEKPQSCEWGTQCRATRFPVTKCSKPPYGYIEPIRKYGEECVLDFVGRKGNCRGEGTYLSQGSCFNFWGYLRNKRLPSTGVSNRIGFCALIAAPYVTTGRTQYEGVGGAIVAFDPFVTPFLNPRTVQMSSTELINYDEELHGINNRYKDNRFESEVGKPCSVTDTTKLLNIWNFYAGLEKDAPQGQDFVADNVTLNAKLIEYNNLIGTLNEPKICQIIWEIQKRDLDRPTRYSPPLTCVSTGSPPDAAGNDGTCQLSNNNDTYAHALNVVNFFLDHREGQLGERNEEETYDPVILQDNPEKQCNPPQTLSTRSFQALDRKINYDDDKYNHIHGDVLEDGNCVDGYACIEDLSENHGIYESKCQLVSGYQPQFTCIDISNRYVQLDECEKRELGVRIKDTLKISPRLGRGAACDHQTERDIREFINGRKTSNYRMWAYLQNNGICASTKLLECTAENTCDCIANTGVRQSADNMFTSDYCYLTSGPCDTDATKLNQHFDDGSDRPVIIEHYGDFQQVGSNCSNGNICAFIDTDSHSCTADNTGKTGIEGEGGPGTISTDEPPTISKPLEPARPFGGAETSSKKPSYLILITIMVTVSF